MLAAVPVAWGWGLGWLRRRRSPPCFTLVAGHGITVGFHRYFTHGSFKAKRPLKIALAVAGSLAIEGPVIRWVADHRRHHAFSDRTATRTPRGATATSVPALIKGLWLRPHGLAVRRRADQPAAGTPPTC